MNDSWYGTGWRGAEKDDDEGALAPSSWYQRLDRAIGARGLYFPLFFVVGMAAIAFSTLVIHLGFSDSGSVGWIHCIVLVLLYLAALELYFRVAYYHDDGPGTYKGEQRAARRHRRVMGGRS